MKSFINAYKNLENKSKLLIRYINEEVKVSLVPETITKTWIVKFSDIVGNTFAVKDVIKRIGNNSDNYIQVCDLLISKLENGNILDFLNIVEKIKDKSFDEINLEEREMSFLKFMLNEFDDYKPKKEPKDEKYLKQLYKDLEDVPTDEDGNIEVDFHVWEKGTNNTEIWHWFDEKFKNGLGKTMY